MAGLNQTNGNDAGNDRGQATGFTEENGKPGLKAAMRLYLFVFVLLIIFGSLAQAAHFEIGMTITQVVIILLPALWFLRRYRVDKRTFSRFKPLQARYIPTILVLAAAMWILNMALAAGLVSGLMELGYEPVQVLEAPETFLDYLIFVLVISVFAGICEEVLFRGAIMPSMESHGLVPAVVFSSLLFALFHVTFLNLFTTFILGMVMAVVVIKTGSLWGGVIYHMFNNFIAATYLYIAGQEEAATEIEPQFFLSLLPIIIAALAAAYFSLRKLHHQSGSEPLLKDRDSWLPRGWFGGIFIVSVILFLIMALLEFAIGFNWLDMGEF